jgi:hypothetical protein
MGGTSNRLITTVAPRAGTAPYRRVRATWTVPIPPRTQGFLQVRQLLSNVTDSARLPTRALILIDTGLPALRRAGRLPRGTPTRVTHRAFALASRLAHSQLRSARQPAHNCRFAELGASGWRDPNSLNWRLATDSSPLSMLPARGGNWTDPKSGTRVGEARFHYGYGSVLDVTEASVLATPSGSIASIRLLPPHPPGGAWLHSVAQQRVVRQ